MSVMLSTASKTVPLLIHNRFSYIFARRTNNKMLWKCEFSRKFKYHEQPPIDLNNIFIQTVGGRHNHTADPRSAPIIQYCNRLRTEAQ